METPENQDTGAETRVAGESQEPFDMVREAFAGLEMALKVRRLYEPEHKLQGEALEELGERFGRAFEGRDDLTVEVEPEALTFDGHPVLKDGRREGAIPYKLFRDGIRSITFRTGLDADETRRLLEVLEARPDSADHFDEDMATLLWKQDFRNIDYVAIDEIGADGPVTAEGGGAMAEMSERIEDLVSSITSLDLPEWTEQSGMRVAAERKEIFEMERLGLSTETADGEFSMEVPATTLERLRGQVESEDAGSLVNRVVDILFDIFREKECSLELEDVRALLSQFLRAGVAGGDLCALNDTLDRFLEQSAPGGPVEWLIDGLMEDLSTEDVMTTLCDVVRKGYSGGPDALSKLLGRLPAASLSWVARQVHDLEDGPEKDVYHEILGARGRENPEATILYLRDGPADRVLQALRTFLEGGDGPGTEEVIADLLRHEEPRVRLEAVKSLGPLASERRTQLLSTAIGDPSMRVRMAALRVIGSTGARALLGALIKSVDEGEQSDEERGRLFQVIAMLGGPVAVDCLKRHIGPRRAAWLRGKKASASRRQMILGLRGVEDESVLTFLAEGTASKDKAFADACRAVRALSRSDRERDR